ncbi:MAG: HD domain-containing protein [Burkholderiaceae bacterium]|nr:HD domain-containing protein [Burkholderiaceae bacterium]
MKLARIRGDLLQVGAPVPVDVYDPSGRLLLRRGHVIESEQQYERLLQTGLFDPNQTEGAYVGTGAVSSGAVIGSAPSQPARARVSIFERLTDATRALDSASALPALAPGFEAAVRGAAIAVRECCALDSDAALAYIMLAASPRYSLRHSVGSAILTALLLARLHHDPARIDAAIAAALTMNVPIFDLQEALSRQQEPPSSEQRAALRLHPVEAVKVLHSHGVDDPVWLQTVEQHHEARDGSGYPAGLKDGAIAREAQIVSLADRYCGLVSARAYRPALAPRRAIKELHERAASAIEPSLIAALIAAVGLFPPGAYVRLANGETAIVVRRLLDPKHPTVYALHQDTTVPYPTPKKRLTGSHRDFEIVADVKPEAVRVKVEPEQLWPPSAVGDTAGAESPI